MVLGRAVGRLAVETRHVAADHGHRLADLQHAAVQTDRGADGDGADWRAPGGG